MKESEGLTVDGEDEVSCPDAFRRSSWWDIEGAGRIAFVPKRQGTAIGFPVTAAFCHVFALPPKRLKVLRAGESACQRGS